MTTDDHEDPHETPPKEAADDPKRQFKITVRFKIPSIKKPQWPESTENPPIEKDAEDPD